MNVKRVTGIVVASMLMVGCGSQLSGSQPTSTARDPARFFSLLSTEPCPPEPCTDCSLSGVGIFAESALDPPLASFNITAIPGNPTNGLRFTDSQTSSVVNYLSVTLEVTNCETINGRDIVTVQGTALRVEGTNQESGNFTFIGSVDAGTGTANPHVDFTYDGTNDFSFDSDDFPVFGFNLLIDNSACQPE